MKNHALIAIAASLVAFEATAPQQVLGPCGSAEEAAPVAARQEVSSELAVQPLPLPGQRALNFELPAVVGTEIKNVQLADYNGKWRVLCFYPADFTFV